MLCLLALPVQQGRGQFIASESHSFHSRSRVGLQQAYVAIKQVVALCSQTPFKCSIAGPPERVRVNASSTAQEATILKPHMVFFLSSSFFFATAESGIPLLKESCFCLLLANRAHLKCCYHV